MGDLATLGKRLHEHVAARQKQVSDGNKSAAVFMVERLTADTPVDTSKAISNWVASLNFPARVELDAHFPSVFGFTALQSARIANAIAKEMIALKDVGETIIISNNASYIRKLNEDPEATKQVEVGFVERIVEAGRQLAVSEASK